MLERKREKRSRLSNSKACISDIIMKERKREMEQKRVKIVETILRDGHQSMLATRMRTTQMIPVLERMDEIGYEAIECWGGATFDSMIRFLEEDPWERLRTIKQYLKKTPIQMLLRGQNLLGYRHYADDVVCAFVNKAVENGVSRIRVFDALNDIRNMEMAIRYGKDAGAHVQGAIVYTISPVHTDDLYLALARELVERGVDSLCIKDMSGLLAPYDAYNLVSKLKASFDIPIDLHSHFTCGLANMSYLKAVEAGVDIIDTALSPFSFGTSQPATESMVVALQNSPYDTGLNLEALEELANYFRTVREEIVEEFGITPTQDVIPEVRRYQIPGGMLSNTRNQLREMGMEDKFFDVLEEMPRVREDMGYPPLVTPTSQIVGTMATMNVMAGARYKTVPNEIKELVRGNYGRVPVPISDAVRQQIIGEEEVRTTRPADSLTPQLKGYTQELIDKEYENLTEEDIITYAMLQDQALRYFDKHRK